MSDSNEHYADSNEHYADHSKPKWMIASVRQFSFGHSLTSKASKLGKKLSSSLQLMDNSRKSNSFTFFRTLTMLSSPLHPFAEKLVHFVTMINMKLFTCVGKASTSQS